MVKLRTYGVLVWVKGSNGLNRFLSDDNVLVFGFYVRAKDRGIFFLEKRSPCCISIWQKETGFLKKLRWTKKQGCSLLSETIYMVVYHGKQSHNTRRTEKEKWYGPTEKKSILPFFFFFFFLCFVVTVV